MREERLFEQIRHTVRRLVIDPGTILCLEAQVIESDKTEAGVREQRLRQLKAERETLQGRIETMYLDRLDGRISVEFFDAKSKAWRDQQKNIEARIAQLATTGIRWAADALQNMKSVSYACHGFEQSEPERKRALVTGLLQNATWKGGKFESSWKSPFDQLALSNSVSRTKERGECESGQEIEIWLPEHYTKESRETRTAGDSGKTVPLQ